MQEDAIADSRSGDFLLGGVRVIDAASFIAGPVATTIMADLGAHVIKGELGKHSVEILREAGYGAAEIDALLASRVVVQGT